MLSSANVASPGITRLSERVALLLTVVLLVLPPGLVAYVWLVPEQIVNWGGVAMADFEPRPLRGWAFFAVVGVLFSYTAPVMWGGWELRALFRGYAHGEIFCHSAASRLRRCALAMVTLAVAGPVTTVALSLALSVGLPEGGRRLVIGIHGEDMGFALIGLAVLVIARVLGEAARLARENAEFV